MRYLIAFIACQMLTTALATGAAPAPTTAPAAAPVASATYDLRFRPTVGLRWAYQIVEDMESRVRDKETDAAAEVLRKDRLCLVVNGEEITEVRDGRATAGRISFGEECWAARREGAKKPTKRILDCAGTTVNVRISADGSVRVTPPSRVSPEDEARMSSGLQWTSGLCAGRPVAVGDRWRTDEPFRALTGLQRADDIAAVVMLQNVRSLEGREVADLAIAAKIVTGSQNSRMTVNMRGTVVVDVATGLTLKADLTGNSQFSGGSAGIKDDKLKVNITGNGKLTFHMIGRIL